MSLPFNLAFSGISSGLQTKNASSGGGATFEDNFSSYANQIAADASWIPVSGTNIRVDVTNDYILHTCTNGTGREEIIYHDLGLISDTSWVLRFSKYTVTQGTSDSHIYISSVAGADNVVTQDFIGVINNGGANNYAARIKDSTVLVDSGDSFTEANLDGSTFYFELIRLSSSAMLFRRYTDSTYTTVVETSNVSTGMTGVISLRYLTFCTNDDNNGETQSIYRYDNIKFYNGITSV